MRQFQQFSVILERDGDRYLSHCPELELTTHGTTVEEARANLIEAIELFFELADAEEIDARLRQSRSASALSFLLARDAEDGCRAIALDDSGLIQDEAWTDLHGRH